jgi:hypothetical protein
MFPLLYDMALFLISNIKASNPAYLEIVKIVAGSTGWIGALVFFAWYKDKSRKTAH